MAITYNITYIPKRGYGVFVNSFSNRSLLTLAYLGLIRDTDADLDETSPTFGQVVSRGKVLSYTDKDTGNIRTHALKVNGNRIGLYATKEQAQERLKELLNTDEQSTIDYLIRKRFFFWPVDRDFVLISAGYYKLTGEVKDKSSVFVRQVKETANSLAKMGFRVEVVKTVTRTITLPKEMINEIPAASFETKTVTASGAVEDKKTISGKYLRRLTAKRKRTTKTNFWRNR